MNLSGDGALSRSGRIARRRGVPPIMGSASTSPSRTQLFDVELGGDGTQMNADHAQTLADRLHAGQFDRDGSPMIDHIRRVAAAAPRRARAVAWLHETLEHTSISEQALLADGLSYEQLRAIRLLTRVTDSPSDPIYVAHIERIAQADGPGADIARSVKRADLADRALHPAPRDDGWTPPYTLGLHILNAGRTRSTPTSNPATHPRTEAHKGP